MGRSWAAWILVGAVALHASCSSGDDATARVFDRGGAGGNMVFDAAVITESGAGGTSAAGGSGGAAAVSGAGGVVTMTDGGAVDSGDADSGVAGSVRCGDAVCSTPAETCVIFYGATSASCVMRVRAQEVCPGGCLIEECDGSEDCPTGQSCHFTFGENVYLWCQDLAWNGKLCTTSADCPTAYPTCRNLTEVYPEAQNSFAALGYQPPRICDQ